MCFGDGAYSEKPDDKNTELTDMTKRETNCGEDAAIKGSSFD